MHGHVSRHLNIDDRKNMEYMAMPQEKIYDMNGMWYMAMPLNRIEMIGRNNMGYMAMPQQTNTQTTNFIINDHLAVRARARIQLVFI